MNFHFDPRMFIATYLDLRYFPINTSFICEIIYFLKCQYKIWQWTIRLECVLEIYQRYESRVITGVIRRADTIFSSRNLFNNEIRKLKQILINNGFTNTEFDNELKTFLLKKDSPPPNNYINKLKCIIKIKWLLRTKLLKRFWRTLLKITHSVLMTMKNSNLLCIIKAN